VCVTCGHQCRRQLITTLHDVLYLLSHGGVSLSDVAAVLLLFCIIGPVLGPYSNCGKHKFDFVYCCWRWPPSSRQRQTAIPADLLCKWLSL
jgi:hypothetical protein